MAKKARSFNLTEMVKLTRCCLSETEHERCKAGTHWNDDEKKCMPVPGEVASAVKHANVSSEDAYHASGKAQASDKDEHHESAASEHDSAAWAHSSAAKAARKAGFHELAAEHDDKSSTHSWNASKHNKKFGDHIEHMDIGGKHSSEFTARGADEHYNR